MDSLIFVICCLLIVEKRKDSSESSTWALSNFLREVAQSKENVPASKNCRGELLWSSNPYPYAVAFIVLIFLQLGRTLTGVTWLIQVCFVSSVGCNTLSVKCSFESTYLCRQFTFIQFTAIFKSTFVSLCLELSTGGFCWSKVLLPTCPCCWALAASIFSYAEVNRCLHSWCYFHHFLTMDCNVYFAVICFVFN